MNNIVLINKPSGWTSNDVVRKIKSVYKYKKVGHAGTLDPLATGLLIVGYNEGTKLLSSLSLDDKEYETVIKFGLLTETGDSSSKVIKKQKTNLTLKQIQEACNWFIENKYMQKPHPYSAVKVNGVKAYALARQNIAIDLKPRLVKINKLKIKKFDKAKQELTLTINVSKGFYVRSFAIDLAKKLNTIGFVKSLNRTKCGAFQLKNAYTLNDYLCKHENQKY